MCIVDPQRGTIPVLVVDIIDPSRYYGCLQIIADLRNPRNIFINDMPRQIVHEAKCPRGRKAAGALLLSIHCLLRRRPAFIVTTDVCDGSTPRSLRGQFFFLGWQLHVSQSMHVVVAPLLS